MMYPSIYWGNGIFYENEAYLLKQDTQSP